MPYKAYKTVLFFVAGGDSFAIGAYIKVPPCQVPEHVGKTVSAMGNPQPSLWWVSIHIFRVKKPYGCFQI